MGSFYVTDITSGRTLTGNEPVVGFLVSWRGSRYPLDQNPNESIIYPGARFELASLPMHGTYYDYGRMVVADEHQIGVKLALAMTQCKTWEDLMRRSLQVDEGVEVAGEKRVYGLALMHRDSFDHLVSSGGSRSAGTPDLVSQKAADVAQMELLGKAYFARRAELKAFSEASKESSEFFDKVCQVESLGRLLGLNGDWAEDCIADPSGGDALKVPPVASYFASGQGAGRAADELKGILRAVGLWNLGHVRSKSPESLEDVPRYRDYVESVWETQRLMEAMYRNGLSFAPSMLAGQDTTVSTVCARELASVLSQSRAQAAWIREYGSPREAKELRDRIHTLREMATLLEDELSSSVAHAESVDVE
jgi:hypothetical protein